MYYPAFFLPALEGGYSVIFPDIPEAVMQGGTIEECVAMAQDALILSLEEYIEAGRPLPPPSRLDCLDDKLRLEMAEPGVDQSRKGFAQLIIVSNMNTQIVNHVYVLPRSAATSSA